MIAKKKPARPKPKKQVPQLQLVEAAVNQIREANAAQSEQVMAELATLRQHVDDIKQMVERLKPAKSRGRGLFKRRRSVPVEVAQTPPEQTLSVDQLLPLLPQLGKFIPQLKNPKATETLKVLSNPAVMSMIQQFLANGSAVKARPVSRTTRRFRL
ncbi:hypothetical protein LOK74_23555 [Brevibacillus humidisoli]|uniref:hypothetical protein n=1 Tax=Brevibacillus humidisoli TaxID=2895522 RepID=UPI001E4EE451|nr:hypothetical protein [Brevibacillus humidisoli]UFJ40925.1 hypothetical protein LOK74_23555 [Brevibacillus humidisoli]